MALVQRVNRVIAVLRAKAAKAGKDTKSIVAVGYATNYALIQHENMMFHHNIGQAKYLEQPARQHEKGIANSVRETYKRGATFAQSLIVGGMFLQRMSIPLVPVDSGVLRNSSFVKLEK